MTAAPVSRDVTAVQAFRDLMSAFPSGVAVITALDADGAPHGMTCTSLTSVAADPPTLLVCLNLRSGTFAAVRDGGGFAVNLLHSKGKRAAELFSSAAPDRFSRLPWRPSAQVGAPLLVEDAFATAECVVGDVHVAEDHAIVIGKVVDVGQREDDPLLYGFRSFSSWER
ncbi:flavin reductase family protein [Allokutzneria albata]|uniref:NADH-FMN oxidoreductase RutF, flavin reductase (DIM6/NTAB) family n=1 Tax=Allokutzneria albata TaxID=211114 RepID=A0A1G9WQ20_ALLAB|nr:flavin reductase family protein [Allokutzneria albata]SDM86560.1 NADH-FMN oxidoreductase RutF, flavin reductase (DIM6/NTAB) family [Allokutzneria albata]